jgi:hypothetical protein
MDGGQSGWESNLPILNPEQRQHVLQWLHEEVETWAEREEEWLRTRERMARETQPVECGLSENTTQQRRM